MKIAIMGADSFVGKNLVENLKNIRDGKNRTRPNLSISDIYLDVVNDSDTVILLPGSDVKYVSSYSGRVIYISPLSGASDEEYLPLDALIYRLPEIIGKWQEPTCDIAYLCHAVANDEEYEVTNRFEIGRGFVR